ncbi:MAG: Holliday junction resolvase RuvX [bacterium]|nr:Holliday junction resolvase RuvX [bacterium]
MSNIISLDIGMKRTGICICLEGILLPQRGEETDKLDKRLCQILSENSYSLAVVGLPLDKDMRETDMAAKIKEKVKNLKSLEGLRIEFFDERLSTKEAERMSRETFKKDKRRDAVDSLSAMLILEEYLRNEKK